MASSINTDNIDYNFPVQGKDNPSQGFRDNFQYIVQALNEAAVEISDLQDHPALPSFTRDQLSSVTDKRPGSIVYVTDVVGGAEPCYFNGTNWFTFSSKTQVA
jgi:hypothetical protein